MSADLSANFWDAWFLGKEFTSDWSSDRFPTWAPILEPFVGSDVKVLEIGSWEGRSAIFFLEYLPRSTITCIDTFEGSALIRSVPKWRDAIPDSERRFDANLSQYGNRVEKIRGASILGLYSLLKSASRFDVIYIDGSHDCDDVMIDSVLSWQMLGQNGILIWDDFVFPRQPRPPHLGINAFLTRIAGEFVELHRGRQLIIRKQPRESFGSEDSGAA